MPRELEAALQQGRLRGLVGATALEAQYRHSLGFADVWFGSRGGGQAPPNFLDLGSGGGLPGLVLATTWAGSEAVLLDAAKRRVEFLEWAVARCGLGDRVTVLHERAEAAGRDERFRDHFSLVVTRSFGPPAVTAESAAPFVVPGGLLVVSEPPETVTSSERWPSEALADLALRLGTPTRVAGYGYQAFAKSDPTPARYPRRVGVPAKRPLF